MLDLKNIELNIVTITESTSVDFFLESLKTVGTTVLFNVFVFKGATDYQHIEKLLNLSGFTDVDSSSKLLYYKVIDSSILIIHLDAALNMKDSDLEEFFYIKDKFWITLNDNNIDYIKNNGKIKDEFFKSLTFDYTIKPDLYDLTVDRPFSERFSVQLSHDNPVRKLELSFKYEKSKYFTASIFHRKGSFIHICYNNPDNSALFSEFMEFAQEKITVSRLVRRSTNLEIDVTPDSDIVDIKDITLDNFHLFWERLNPEQVLLLEMVNI
jgi:hypothetical protein